MWEGTWPPPRLNYSFKMAAAGQVIKTNNRMGHHGARGRGDGQGPGPWASVTASVTKVFGLCLLGLMPGNTWRIGAAGSLSRPMCRPGATALSGLFQMANGDAMGRSACCECVIARREVTFTVQEPV